MNYFNLYFGLFIFACSSGFGQHNSHSCGADIPSQQWEDRLQELITEHIANTSNTKRRTGSYVIPVVFHIIHNGEAIGTFPNLPQGQINSQMTVLNQDFSGNAYNAANYPANAFINWASNQALPLVNLDANGRVKIANFDIQFCLATKDTSGNILTEPGIDRIDRNSKGWPNPTTYSTQTTFKNYLDGVLKPQSIWDVTKYLNVWITDKSNALTYGGVSSIPPFSGLPDLPNNATDSTDGIWCFAKATGSYQLFTTGHYVSNNVDGRTLTHEAGHYVGLRHIWGDATCGNDFCNDTPPAADQNAGSPTYPFNVGSCAIPSNNPDGEMFMNFMDYTMGPSKYMFTTDQRTRAQTAMLNSPFRNQLGTHGLCATSVGLTENKNRESVMIFPNPSSEKLSIIIEDQYLISVKIHNVSGELVQEHFENEFSVSNLANGIYFVRVQTNRSVFVQKFIKH